MSLFMWKTFVSSTNQRRINHLESQRSVRKDMQASYPLPSAPSVQCVTRVQLNISCKNLKDKDVLSKSDPMAVVMIFKDGNWSEVNGPPIEVLYQHVQFVQRGHGRGVEALELHKLHPPPLTGVVFPQSRDHSHGQS